MSTHNIGFYEDLTKIIFELSSNIIKYAPYFFAGLMSLFKGGLCFFAMCFQSSKPANPPIETTTFIFPCHISQGSGKTWDSYRIFIK